MTTEMYMSILNCGGTGSAAGKTINRAMAGMAPFPKAHPGFDDIAVNPLAMRYAMNSIIGQRFDKAQREQGASKRMTNQSLFSNLSRLSGAQK